MEFNFEIFRDLLNLCRLSLKELSEINGIFKNRPLNYIDNVLYDCPKKLIYYSSDIEANYHVYVTEYLNSLVIIFKGNTFTENEIKLTNSKRVKINIPPIKKKIKVNKRSNEIFDSLQKKINLKIKEYLGKKVNNHQILGDDEHIINQKSVIFTGHGLGGTISILGIVKFANKFKNKNVNFYSVTFGSPNVGGLRFSNLFNKSILKSYRFLSDVDSNILFKNYKNINNLKGNIWLYHDYLNNHYKICRHIRMVKNYFNRNCFCCLSKKKIYKCENYHSDLEMMYNKN